MEALSSKEVNERLSSLEGWSIEDGKLHKKFQFKTFQEAFGKMTEIALVAEKLDHHPEWYNVYNRLDISLITHDAGPGVTEKDFHLAREIEGINSL